MESTHERARKRKRVPIEPAMKAGWSVEEFTQAIGICREQFYALDVAPRSLRLGNRRIILEAPAAYLERLERIASTQQRAA